MSTDFDFSWSQFLWIVFIAVGVPSMIAVGIIRFVVQSEHARPQRLPSADGPLGTQTGGGTLGLWATGFLAFVLGFLSCSSWLSWSADYRGAFRGPGLPAPKEFPTWQVIACGATVVLACLVSAHLSRWVMAGGLAAAAGTAAGFTTAFGVEASTDVTGQSGVGVVLSQMGWGIGLGILMLVRGAWLTGRRGRYVGSSRS